MLVLFRIDFVAIAPRSSADDSITDDAGDEQIAVDSSEIKRGTSPSIRTVRTFPTLLPKKKPRLQATVANRANTRANTHRLNVTSRLNATHRLTATNKPTTIQQSLLSSIHAIQATLETLEKVRSETDEHYHFAMQLAPALRNIPQHKCVRVKAEIMAILAEAMNPSDD